MHQASFPHFSLLSALILLLTLVVDEGSESGQSSVDLQQQTRLLHHRLNPQYEAGYAAQPGSGVLSMGCFTSHRPSTAAISLTSQTTGFSTITGTTTTTATSTGTSTDDDLALIRSAGHSSQHNGKDHRESIKQKRGILNKLFKFGSRKEKKSAHASDRLIQDFGDRELEQQQMQAAARMHALSEQERIQEHVRRLKEQQQLLLRHQQQQKQLQLSHQIYQQQQASQLHDSVVDDSDKYGHYMNHYQIQESMRNLGVGVPVAYSNRPIPVRSRTVPQPPPPLPPGRPPLAHSSVRLRQHVSPTTTTTVIDARGVPVSRSERPLSNYYEYEGTSSLPPQTSINASAINQNVIYEQRLMHQQHQQQLMQQQQHEAAIRTAQLRHQMLKQQQHQQQQQQLHHAVLYQQPAAGPMTRMQSDLYGTSGLIVSPLEGSGLRPVDQNLFRRQLSNHRIVPTPQGLPVRVRQPVYQNHNVYVYSNPPVGNSPVFASSPHQSTSIIRTMANSQIHQASHL